MVKTDLLRTFKPYYTAKPKPGLKLTEAGEFLSIIGTGDAPGPGYTERIRTLRAVALELRKLSRVAGVDFVVPRLEVLWDFSPARPVNDTPGEASSGMPRAKRGYCLMLRMPCFVTRALAAQAARQVATEGLPLAIEVELHARLGERVVQVLHRGTPGDKPRCMERLEAFMRDIGLVQDGPYHEIYLMDPVDGNARATRTIIRVPVKKQGQGGSRLR